MTLVLNSPSPYLYRETYYNEKEVSSGQTCQKCVGGGFEGGLFHNCQYYQDVATHSQAKGEAEIKNISFPVVVCKIELKS